MEIVTLDLFKKHVCADDFSADDELLRHYLTTAQDAIIRRIGRSVDELVEMGGGTMPKAIEQAVMLLGGHWYNQREAAATTQMYEVPYGILYTIKPFIKLVEP